VNAMARALEVVSRMRKNPAPKSSRANSSRREKHHQLRRQGLHPIQIWIPDVRSRSFIREAHRQSLLVARSGAARDDQAFVDAISEWRN